MLAYSTYLHVYQVKHVIALIEHCSFIKYVLVKFHLKRIKSFCFE
uniref:Uncharacterized protein n=1 Tax=Ascaris lumbricoides TaxID=6252 RepID=A0A0M3HIR4_ASCLU